MSERFSIVYPTRHRPEFIRHALRILEAQRHDNFEVVVSDNYVDPALSCEQICHESRLANLTYVRPSRPVGMVENWEHARQFATGDYICYLTDKMFVLPGALSHIDRVIDAARGPEIVSWTSDAYSPESYANYFGRGQYVRVPSDVGSRMYRPFLPADDLDRRGRADVSRPEQNPSEYCRGKLVFGAYRRELVQRIVKRYGALFHSISPDYTSMVLGLTEAHDAVELTVSCVVSLNTDLSTGMLADRSDSAALSFLDSLAGGAEQILPNLLVPGLYVSQHNLVAHDFLALKRAFDLKFEFNAANWLVYCLEDVNRSERRWSDPRVEAEQKGLLRAFVESLEPEVAATVQARIAARAAPTLARRLLPHWLRWRLHRTWQQLRSSRSESIEAAVEVAARNRGWATGAQRRAT